LGVSHGPPQRSDAPPKITLAKVSKKLWICNAHEPAHKGGDGREPHRIGITRHDAILRRRPFWDDHV
jgi:hypothetical protein